MSVEAFRACPRTVLLGRIGDDDGESSEKGLANLGLESCPCRRCLVLRGDEHLSSNTYEAISHMEVAMGTTLIIPEFRSESVPTTMDELRSLVRSGRAQAAPASGCPETTPALATKKYENWWGRRRRRRRHLRTPLKVQRRLWRGKPQERSSSWTR